MALQWVVAARLRQPRGAWPAAAEALAHTRADPTTAVRRALLGLINQAAGALPGPLIIMVVVAAAARLAAVKRKPQAAKL